jgi:hypothetical protein
MKSNKSIPVWEIHLSDKKTKKGEWMYVIAPELELSKNGKYKVTPERRMKDIFSKKNSQLDATMFIGYISSLSILKKEYYMLPKQDEIREQPEENETDE